MNGLDWDLVKKDLLSRRLHTKADLYASLRWMLSLLNDPYTTLLLPADYSTFRESIEGSEIGIGASVRLKNNSSSLLSVLLNTFSPSKKPRDIELCDVLKGGPALRAGLKEGDVVVAVDRRPTSTMSVKDISDSLHGKDRTRVELLIQCAPGTFRKFSVKREKVQIDTVFSEIVVVESKKKKKNVAYLQVTEWSKNSFKESLRALGGFLADDGTPVDALVIDLRDNSGGVLPDAIEFTRLFVKKKGAKLVNFVVRGETSASVVETSTFTWVRDAILDLLSGSKWRRKSVVSDKIPICLLVNQNTASASELVAAALRDNCRATIVGTKTYGKSSIQSVVQLEDGEAAFKLTIATYTTPLGEPITGIVPDIFADYLPKGKRAVAHIFPRLAGKLSRKLSICTPPT
mmetsp:Transcript_26867/g.104283  ORF Transcript_26867/g.104283 Transcript_26867/m.104283 type:complete len:403 (-) Transcript_26867:270-1478(-)|eukprot:CAMPEP_0113962688 /NCGR_PEP_ID=MMETSP0011_2-20120614/6067_1 /TAXON_ID=101924 /ORGANISM="Rhodosorus marinus" /LENGTH=402 /DNA_ID=CAMNT_0000974595 /DNA_START=281 /DNA_END=1489 /DNA_ORIENTATION=+ /assembly_acc=CAM_ASM_000156